MLWCDGVIGDGNADWAIGDSLFGESAQNKDDHISMLATTFSVWLCDTGDSCVRWGETGTWTRS